MENMFTHENRCGKGPRGRYESEFDYKRRRIVEAWNRSLTAFTPSERKDAMREYIELKRE